MLTWEENFFVYLEIQFSILLCNQNAKKKQFKTAWGWKISKFLNSKISISVSYVKLEGFIMVFDDDFFYTAHYTLGFP